MRHLHMKSLLVAPRPRPPRHVGLRTLLLAVGQETRKELWEARARCACEAAACEATAHDAAEDSSQTRAPEGSVCSVTAGQRPTPKGSVTENDSGAESYVE